MKKTIQDWWWSTRLELPWPEGRDGHFSWAQDPNIQYLDWMNKTLGRRGYDWEWDLTSGSGPMFLLANQRKIIVYLRRGRKELAPLVQLRFS